MARNNQRRKKTSSMFSALVIEGLAVVVFVFLFSQARAQRQQETALEPGELPLIEEIFEQTPLQGLLSSVERDRSRRNW